MKFISKMPPPTKLRPKTMLIGIFLNMRWYLPPSSPKRWWFWLKAVAKLRPKAREKDLGQKYWYSKSMAIMALAGARLVGKASPILPPRRWSPNLYSTALSGEAQEKNKIIKALIAQRRECFIKHRRKKRRGEKGALIFHDFCFFFFNDGIYLFDGVIGKFLNFS